jgi:hypothetical protein
MAGKTKWGICQGQPHGLTSRQEPGLGDREPNDEKGCSARTAFLADGLTVKPPEFGTSVRLSAVLWRQRPLFCDRNRAIDQRTPQRSFGSPLGSFPTSPSRRFPAPPRPMFGGGQADRVIPSNPAYPSNSGAFPDRTRGRASPFHTGQYARDPRPGRSILATRFRKSQPRLSPAPFTQLPRDLRRPSALPTDAVDPGLERDSAVPREPQQSADAIGNLAVVIEELGSRDRAGPRG